MSEPICRDLVGQMDAYIVHQSDALDVQMLPVKGVLEKFHNIMPHSILRSEA